MLSWAAAIGFALLVYRGAEAAYMDGLPWLYASLALGIGSLLLFGGLGLGVSWIVLVLALFIAHVRRNRVT